MTGIPMYRARLDYGLDIIDMSVATMRKLSVYALVAFPLGAVIVETSDPVTPFALLIGVLLMFSSIFTGAALAATRAYRMVEGRKGFGGEYERALRFEAMAQAYSVLTKMIFAALLYGFLAEANDLWLPREKSDWNLLLLGTGNLLMILPTFILVWSGKLDDEDEDGGA